MIYLRHAIFFQLLYPIPAFSTPPLCHSVFALCVNYCQIMTLNHLPWENSDDELQLCEWVKFISRHAPRETHFFPTKIINRSFFCNKGSGWRFLNFRSQQSSCQEGGSFFANFLCKDWIIKRVVFCWDERTLWAGHNSNWWWCVFIHSWLPFRDSYNNNRWRPNVIGNKIHICGLRGTSQQ